MNVGDFVQTNTATRYARSHPIGYVVRESGCWEWTGTILPDGYGQIWINGKHAKPHRYVYEQHRGPIPAGLQLDHLCRNRKCVNPAHLEAVTHKVNVLRGVGTCAQKARQTHCKNGHPLAGENLLPSVLKRGARCCRACDRAWRNARNARRRAS